MATGRPIMAGNDMTFNYIAVGIDRGQSVQPAVPVPVPRATLIILPLEQCPAAPLSLSLSLSLYHRHC